MIEILKLVLDAVGDVGFPKFLLNATPNIVENHIVVNHIPQSRENLLSNNLVNVNLFINKKGQMHDIATIEAKTEVIIQNLENYSSKSTRRSYYGFQILTEPTVFDYESTNFSLVNIRVTTTTNI